MSSLHITIDSTVRWTEQLKELDVTIYMAGEFLKHETNFLTLYTYFFSMEKALKFGT